MGGKKIHSVPLTLWLAFGCLSFLCATISVFAAAEDVRVIVNPSSPRPGEIVEISLESYITDLNQAEIVWQINGKVERQGMGEKAITTESAILGKATNMVITVKTTDVGTIKKTLAIRSANVDLVWQANSYTPPFYRGKALAPSESFIKIVAMPNMISEGGRRLRSSEVTFIWKRNGIVIGSQSGTGKDTFTFKSGRLPEDEPLIEVEATSPQNNLRAYGRLAVPITSPSILFYEEDPLRGVLLERALSQGFTLDKSEMTIVAYPYFAEGTGIENSDLAYEWRINNGSVEPSGRANVLTVRAPGGNGVSSISFSTQNSQKLFESAVQNIAVEFGN